MTEWFDDWVDCPECGAPAEPFRFRLCEGSNIEHFHARCVVGHYSKIEKAVADAS